MNGPAGRCAREKGPLVCQGLRSRDRRERSNPRFIHSSQGAALPKNVRGPPYKDAQRQGNQRRVFLIGSREGWRLAIAEAISGCFDSSRTRAGLAETTKELKLRK